MSSIGDDENEIDRRNAESNRIGAEGNRIGAESDRIFAETGRVEAYVQRTENDKRLVRLRHSKDVGQLFAYILIVGMFAFFFWQDALHDREVNLQSERICESSVENRASLVSLVTAVELLGRSLITDGRKLSELSEDESHSIELFAQFRIDQMKLLEKPVC